MPSTEPDLSTTRYGGRKPLSRRTWAIISVVGVTLGVVAAWFVSDAYNSNRFHADVMAYEVTSDHAISVTIRVDHSSGDPAQCDVAAQAADHTYVGETTFDVPRTDGDESIVTDVVATERRAVTAVVQECRLLD
ncbi:DUF4307 domain-containing protein [Mumia sp. Pv 4-285]|uniref:DUF4307 domain-containing protein n=1 Tax=Mumia qirimensis TaxID=3234852 RepID=UPI00351DA4D4